MSFTYGDALALAQDLLDDDTNNMWSADAKLRFANRANELVYNELYATNPDVFLQTSQITWPANTSSADMSGASYLNASVRGIKQILETTTSAAPGQGNYPVPWIAAGSYRELTDAYDDARVLGNRRHRRYYMADETLHVAPPPTGATYLTVVWYPTLTALTTSSSAVLNGKADAVASSVGYALAYLMNAKQNAQNPMVAELWAQARQSLKAYRTNAGPRRTVVTRIHG